MEKSKEKERRERFEEVRPEGEEDDGIVGDCNQTQNQQHHKVAQELESGAEPKRVKIHR